MVVLQGMNTTHAISVCSDLMLAMTEAAFIRIIYCTIE